MHNSYSDLQWCNHVRQIPFSTCQYQFVFRKRKTNIISYLHIGSVHSIYIMSHRTCVLEYRISNCFQMCNNFVHNLAGKFHNKKCSRVGCVPPAAVAVSGWVGGCTPLSTHPLPLSTPPSQVHAGIHTHPYPSACWDTHILAGGKNGTCVIPGKQRFC